MALQNSPEFNSFSPDFIRSILLNGAAKLSGPITVEATARLEVAVRGCYVDDLDRIIAVAPVLGEIAGCFYTPENKALGIKVSSSWTQLLDAVQRYSAFVHRDRMVKNGITFLAPLTGREATFGADESRFELNRKTGLTKEYPAPSFFMPYGTGDIIGIRQQVSEVNGIVFDPPLPQMYHAGLGSDTRRILTIDVEAERFMLPGVTLEQEVPGVVG